MKHVLTLGIKAALNAGSEILDVYSSEDFGIEYKEDNSPLTLADKRAHTAIEAILQESGIHILSEEGKSVSFEERRDWRMLWVVDPLDGTKEFVKRNGEFTVNIALVRDGTPILGVIYVPVRKQLYFAAEGVGAYKLENSTGDSVDTDDIQGLIDEAMVLPIPIDKHTYVVVGSRSHMSEATESYIKSLSKEHDTVEMVSAGSALKLCLVAEGVADEYPRFAPTMEWDVAAGHAIANFAGKQVTVFETGEELKYNREDLVNPWFLVK
ncbi:3'(2'),5'-bisphosphate nucleotidase CysQ [Flavobacteriales bacterium AH-315-E23]|nr:3'(2'),5'-bisphosphate nucleotidase CysQ [Flavobacteriales bacterium AH-315-E23]